MRSRRVVLAAGTAIAIGVLAWPGPAASTGSSLGGYSASAMANVIRLEMYEPVFPLPSDPQGDFTLGYANATASPGPSTRATASYLWPGYVLGDGFDQITGRPGSTYPVQVNSRYPATESAPAKNRAQLTDGNGMSTSTDGVTTTAKVTGLGIAGPHTDLSGGLGDGLGSLTGQKPSAGQQAPPKVPVPVSATLAQLMTAENMTSTTTITVGDKLVKTTATAAASSISILHGVLGIDGFKSSTTITSDGKKATATGSVRIGGLTIAGIEIGLGDKGVLTGDGKAVKLPELPKSATDAITKLGVTIAAAPVERKVEAAAGSYSATALVITIDTATLKDAINGPLGAIVKLLGPDAATNLAPLLQLKPKFVINLGQVTANTSATPAYVYPSGGGSSTPPPSGPTGSPGGTGGGSYGGNGGFGSGTGSTGGFDGGTGSTGGFDGGTGTGSGTTPVGAQPTGFNLPTLGTVPKFLVLLGLVLAAAFAWLLQTAGGSLLGGAAPCRFGLSKGVPNLREG